MAAGTVDAVEELRFTFGLLPKKKNQKTSFLRWTDVEMDILYWFLKY